MTDLDMSLSAVFADRGLLDRVIEAIRLEQNADFMTALDMLHSGSDWSHVHGSGTLRSALEWVGDTDYLSQTLRTLERRESLLERGRVEASELRRDGMGRVTLDQGEQGETADVGEAMHSAAERERRYARARKAGARYLDRAAFDAEDRAYWPAVSIG